MPTDPTPGAPRTPVAIVETMWHDQSILTVACNDGSIWWMSNVKDGWMAYPPIPGTPAAIAQEATDEH